MILTAWQAWLAVAAAGAVAYWLFALKVRPPRLDVPSLIVWRRVFADKRNLTWWERIRWAVSCAITVIVAVALAIALTEPGRRRDATRSLTVLVLDSSWSMGATRTSGGTRWSRAIDEALSVARSADGEVAVATTSSGVILGPTIDDLAVAEALAAETPSGGESGRWPVVAGATSVHFFTDGVVTRAIEPSVVVHSVFEAAPNVAITAFEAREPMSATARSEAFLEVANFSTRSQQAHLTVTRDAEVIADRQVQLDAGEIVREVVNLGSAGGPRLRARLSAADNALAIDDTAVAWVAEADPIQVRLVSANPSTLSGVLGRDAAVRIDAVAPAAYRAEDPADVVVFDRWLPAQPPAKPMLAIAPPSISWLGTAGASEETLAWTTVQPHAVVDGVDLVMHGVGRVHRYEATDVTVLASAGQGRPIVAVQDRADRRLVLLNFPIDASLKGGPAFPVLVSNAIEWLARPYRGTARPPGPVALPASTSRVVSPEGEAVPLTRAADRVLATLARPGLYLVRAGGSQSVLPVNAGSRDLSNLTQSSVNAGAATTPNEAAAGRRWWTYGVIAALVLLVIEWWTWQRRITV